ncbi:MAG: sodium-dependent transporter [Fusobacteriaceae bacterium]
MDSSKRGNWSSSIGFILAAAGSAIGLGNLWKFPYQAGKNGGGAFVLVYLLLVLILGFTLILGEMIVGRKGKSDAFGSYNKIKKGWGIVGGIGILTCYIILSYYSVIGGWVLKYILDFVTGGISGDPGAHFGGFISNSFSPLIYLSLFLGATAFIVLKGVAGGIEKASKIMMPTLFAFLIIIVIRSVTLEGASAGIEFFLKPDFSVITGAVILSALGQVFFSLSIGMAVMITYGSYLPEDTNMLKSALIIPALDTLVALLAGLAVLPAVFAFGLEPSAGPGLMFITLPKVFEQLPFGNFFGIIFFVLVLFAALTSSISLLEVPVAFLVDQLGWNRKKAIGTLLIGLFILAVPASLSMGIMENVNIFFGMNFFDFLCYLTDNLFLPIGGLLLCIFIGFVWDKKDVENEITNNGTISFSLIKLWFFLIRFIAPTVIFVILLQAVGIIKL